jgi:probable O-glycosylation ligase (exosortase A-associated)
MRDLILTAFVFGTIPFILRNPYYGLLMWVWLGIMNPHRLAWGFAATMPFAYIVALCTMASMLFNSKKLHPFPGDRVAILMVLFVVWMCVSPWFAFHPDLEYDQWQRAFKIQLMTLLALVIVGSRQQIHILVWVLMLSLGYFSIKGGIFTIFTGGNFRVYGPDGTYIEENNALGLATIIMVPFFRYLQLHAGNLWLGRACLAAMLFSVVSAFGSQSRGAFIAAVAMLAFLWMKSDKKALFGMLLALVLALTLLFMPESWHERMASIGTYQEDSSAMSRINAWWVGWNVAADRFPFGGGFAMWTAPVFARYAPDPTMVYVAHSIYFQILGEHGFIGLALFLGIFVFSWMNGSWIIRHAKGRVDLAWARDLAAMCQVGLIGFMVGGAFLSLAYFDLPYYIVVILIVLRRIIATESVIPDKRMATRAVMP